MPDLPEPDVAREWLEDDDIDSPLRGARGRDVRAGEGRWLPAPRDRRGGDDRGQRAGAADKRLPDLDLPLARQRARARNAAGERDGGAVRARRRLLGGTRRLDAHVRPGAPLHGRLRDRRRQPADRGGDRAGERLPGRGGRDALHVRRWGLQPGHVRGDAEPGGAVAAAGGVHGDQQPVRDGDRAAAPLGRDGPPAQGREPRRAGRALRRDGRARHARRRRGGARAGARGAPAGAGRGGDIPLPRALDGGPRGVPLQGGGRAVAPARPDPRVRRAARARGRARRAGARRDRRARPRARRRGGGVRRSLALPGTGVAVRRRVRPRRPGPGLVLGADVRAARRRVAGGADGADGAGTGQTGQTGANDEVSRQITTALQTGEEA